MCDASLNTLSHNSPVKVCVDITDLLAYAEYNNVVSGIQRVIVRAISQFVNEHGLDKVDLIAFDSKNKKFIRTSPVLFQNDYAFDHRVFCEHFNISSSHIELEASDLRNHLSSRYRNNLVFAFHFARLRFLNYINGGKSFAKRRISENSIYKGRKIEASKWNDANFNSNDSVLILGANWEFPFYYEILKQEKLRGNFKVFQLVHDLIPLVVPEHVGPGVPLRFEQWFRAVLGVCDVVFANSEATQRDIYRYSKLTGQLAPTVSTVPLAHEFQIPALPDNARHHIRIFNERSLRLVEHASQRVLFDTIEPYVLIVGTIESRKNILRFVRHQRHWHKLGTFPKRVILVSSAPRRTDNENEDTRYNSIGRTGFERDSPRHSEAVFSRRQNQNCA